MKLKNAFEKNQGQLDILEIYKDQTYVKGISGFRPKIMVLRNNLWTLIACDLNFTFKFRYTETQELVQSLTDVDKTIWNFGRRHAQETDHMISINFGMQVVIDKNTNDM